MRKLASKNKTYIKQITEVISILHDMKHDGSLPKKFEKWRNWIETFSPDKIIIDGDEHKR
jgi:hypothetical protein